MFYRLLFGKEAEYLSNIDHLVAKEIADFRTYTTLYKRKLKLLKDFIERVTRQRNVAFSKKVFQELEEHLLELDRSEFIIEARDVKKDRKLVSELNLEEEEDRGLQTPIISIKQHLGQLLKLRRVMILLVRRQIQWIKNHSNMEFPIKKEDIQPLIRLINQEGQLLFNYGLSGSQGERELLVEIYNEIMPLKERVKREKIESGAATDPDVWTWIDGRVRVVKKYGSLAKGKYWKKDEVIPRFQNMKRFYAFLKEAGVSVPDHNTLAVMEQWEKTPSGLRPTGYYQVAMSQEHIGENVILVYKRSNNKRLIMRIYRQMLNNTLKAIRHNTHWMLDFKPPNFCWNGRKVIFVDTETAHFFPRDPTKGDFTIRVDLPIKDQVELMRLDERTQREERPWDRKYMLWLRFRLADTRGIFLWLLMHSVAAKIEFKDDIEGETLKFFEKHGMQKEFRFLTRFMPTKGYKEDLIYAARTAAPHNLPKLMAILQESQHY